MLYVSLLRKCHATTFEAANAELHAILRKNFGIEGLNVRLEFGQCNHSRRTLRLERRVTREHHYRVDMLASEKVQKLGDSPNVLAILVDRVLELVAIFVEHLRPLRCRSTCEQPALIVL